VQVIGGAFCVAGIVALLLSARGTAGLLSTSGIGSIIFGLVLLFMPNAFTNVLIYLLGFLLLFAGAMQLALLFSSRRFGRVPVFSFFLPVVTLALGVVVIANPFETRETIVVLFGIAAIYWGVCHLVNYYAVKKTREAHRQEDDVVDTDYEEV
jgi:uncharacterized membrane protein HdeD (DUF308 family)